MPNYLTSILNDLELLTTLPRSSTYVETIKLPIDLDITLSPEELVIYNANKGLVTKERAIELNRQNQKTKTLLNQGSTGKKNTYELHQSDVKRKQVETKEKEIQNLKNKEKAVKDLNGILSMLNPSTYYNIFQQTRGNSEKQIDPNSLKGFVFDMIADPTSWLSLGTAPLLKVGTKGSAKLISKNFKPHIATLENIKKYNSKLLNNEEVINNLVKAELDLADGVFKMKHLGEIPELFELGLHTPKGLKAYPDGVDVLYRGVNASSFKAHPEDYAELGTRYNSLFMGDKVMAGGYLNGLDNKDPKFHNNFDEAFKETLNNELNPSYAILLVVPKGKIIDIGDVLGERWSLIHNKLINKEPQRLKDNLKDLEDLMANPRYAIYRESLLKLKEELLKKIADAPKVKYFVPEIDSELDYYLLNTGKISTDDLANILDGRNDLTYNGIRFKNIHDGITGDETIWKLKPGLYPKSTTGSNFTFNLFDRNMFKKLGGKLKKNK